MSQNAKTDSCVEACCAPTAPVKLRCPVCGSKGQPVEKMTLKHHVNPEHLTAVENGPFNFCRTPSCNVVYFNADSVTLRKRDVRTRVGLKETEDPVLLCYCFGFTERMVREEVAATSKCGIPQRITAEIKARNCACEIRNPQGSCCLGNVNAAVKKVTTMLAGKSKV